MFDVDAKAARGGVNENVVIDVFDFLRSSLGEFARLFFDSDLSPRPVSYDVGIAGQLRAKCTGFEACVWCILTRSVVTKAQTDDERIEVMVWYI